MPTAGTRAGRVSAATSRLQASSLLSLLAKPQAITFPIPALAMGLLAARPDFGARDMPTQAGNAPRSADRTTTAGEIAALVSLCRKCCDHDGGPEGRRRSQGSCPFQPALAVGNNRDLVCTLSGEDVLADETGASVSAPPQALSLLAGRRGRGLASADHCRRPLRARQTLSCRRLVLVPRQPRADDRAGPGRRAGDGRPLRLHPVPRFVFNDRLADCRLGCRLEQVSTSSRSLAGHPSGLLFAGAGIPYLPSSGLPARYGSALAPRIGVDSGQLHRTRSFGRSAAQAGKNRRGHRAYSRRARHPPGRLARQPDPRCL